MLAPTFLLQLYYTTMPVKPLASVTIITVQLGPYFVGQPAQFREAPRQANWRNAGAASLAG
jgi:hypothetical protein